MKQYCYVYETKNIINNKVYIGIRKNRDPYGDPYLGSGLLLKRAIDKYGTVYFKKRILVLSDSWDYVRNIEKKLVTEKFILTGNTYNLSIGGQGGNTVTSIESNKKVRISHAKSWESVSRRKAAANRMHERLSDPKERHKISIRTKGEGNPTNVFSRQDILDIANLMAEGWLLDHLSRKYNHRKNYFDELKRLFNTSEFYSIPEEVHVSIKVFSGHYYIPKHLKYFTPPEIYKQTFMDVSLLKYKYIKKLNEVYTKLNIS